MLMVMALSELRLVVMIVMTAIYYAIPMGLNTATTSMITAMEPSMTRTLTSIRTASPTVSIWTTTGMGSSMAWTA